MHLSRFIGRLLLYKSMANVIIFQLEYLCRIFDNCGLYLKLSFEVCKYIHILCVYILYYIHIRMYFVRIFHFTVRLIYLILEFILIIYI